VEFKEFIHYDKAMECAVLGACLIEKTAYSRVRGLISKECFYSSSNQIVFGIISEMWENSYPIDLLTVAQYIVRDKRISELSKVNVAYYLSRLTNGVVSTAHLEYHSLLVRQLYAEREMVKIKNAPDDVSGDIISRSEKMRDELFKISQIKVINDWHDMIDVVLELHKHMDSVQGKDIIGVPTGFTKFDIITGGLVKGDMIVLAARPSVGKSALLGAIAIHAAKQNFKIGIISLEMSEVQLVARMGSLISDIEFYKIFRNTLNEDSNERKKLHSDLENLANLPIKISDKTNVNINDIRAKVGQLISREQIDILFIDYLQLLDSETGLRNTTREQEVSKMSRGFKLMAKEFDIPVVVLAQLNRESEKLVSKKPQLHHLRESGSIEQDADIVVFLHRDWKSGIKQTALGSSTEFEADIIIAKGRNIETAEIKIGFEPAKMKFYELGNYPTFSATTKLPYKETEADPFPKYD